MRLRLFRSAERSGGQRAWNIFALPRKKAEHVRAVHEKDNMKKLINNSHYLVERGYSLNAVNGSNHRGVVIRIRKKRTMQEIEISLPVWLKIAQAVHQVL